MFPHPADNGFPSDHTALATAISVVVWQYRRRVAWAMVVLSVLIGAARVAAHVHHTQDIVAALIIGLCGGRRRTCAWWTAARKPAKSRRLTGRLGSPSPAGVRAAAEGQRSGDQAGEGEKTMAVAIAAMPSPRPVSPSPSVVVAETDTGAATAAPSTSWASRRRGPSFGLVADDLDGDVADDKAGVGHDPRGLRQQRDTGGAGQLRAVGAEMGAQVSEPGSGEERVAGSVGGDVGI